MSGSQIAAPATKFTLARHQMMKERIWRGTEMLEETRAQLKAPIAVIWAFLAALHSLRMYTIQSDNLLLRHPGDLKGEKATSNRAFD